MLLSPATTTPAPPPATLDARDGRPPLAALRPPAGALAVRGSKLFRSALQLGAVLSQLDAGFFGQGIYLTLDAEYCISEYGVNVYQQTVVPLLVCAVVIGNAFPVVEMPCAPAPPDGPAMRRLRGCVVLRSRAPASGLEAAQADL